MSRIRRTCFPAERKLVPAAYGPVSSQCLEKSNKTCHGKLQKYLLTGQERPVAVVFSKEAGTAARMGRESSQFRWIN